mgnify:FL=1|tara:strand:+ start:206 stop:637 length:432 start_codon:yes stop_codon:yes gene_type:complete
MEEPLRTVIAGMIGGALMGLVFVTHISLLLVNHPPAVLIERAAVSNVSRLITITAFVTFIGWNVLAIIMSFGAQVNLEMTSSRLSFAPSVTYLLIIAFLTLFIAIPALVIFRDRKMHVFAELLFFVGVFGFLIPNLVVAVHRL